MAVAGTKKSLRYKGLFKEIKALCIKLINYLFKRNQQIPLPSAVLLPAVLVSAQRQHTVISLSITAR